MSENSLLSPHRRPPRPANNHDGSITTEAPNVIWGADGAAIPTVEDRRSVLNHGAPGCKLFSADQIGTALSSYRGTRSGFG